MVPEDDRTPRPTDAVSQRRGRRPVLPLRAMPQVACAFCGSRDTEPDGIYGCHMMLAQYYCRTCHSSFDWVREEWEPVSPAS